MDHVVATTPRYPTANIPPAKCTASSESISSLAEVWHADRNPKSASAMHFLIISDNSRRPLYKETASEGSNGLLEGMTGEMNASVSVQVFFHSTDFSVLTFQAQILDVVVCQQLLNCCDLQYCPWKKRKFRCIRLADHQ